DSRSNFFAGWADTLTFGATNSLRNGMNINGGTDHSGTAYGVGGAAATGVAVGVVGAGAVTLGARILVSGGTSILTIAGVPAANAATISTATVTLGVFASGVAGTVDIGVNAIDAVQHNNWVQTAYYVGMLAGGFAV